MLRSFDLPSILLRNPSERDDPNSLYSKAVKALENGDNSILTQHIKSRIIEAQAGNEFKSDVLKEITTLRVALKDVCLKIQGKIPGFNLSLFFKQTFCEVGVKHEKEPGNARQKEKNHWNEILTILSNKYNQLMLASPVGKQAVKDALNGLTQTDWKVNTKDGCKIWCQGTSSEADAVISKLQGITAFEIKKAKMEKVQDTYVVLLTRVDVDALISQAKEHTLKNANKPKV